MKLVYGSSRQVWRRSKRKVAPRQTSNTKYSNQDKLNDHIFDMVLVHNRITEFHYLVHGKYSFDIVNQG